MIFWVEGKSVWKNELKKTVTTIHKTEKQKQQSQNELDAIGRIFLLNESFWNHSEVCRRKWKIMRATEIGIFNAHI